MLKRHFNNLSDEYLYNPTLEPPAARRRLVFKSASKQFIVSTMSAMATDSSSSSSSSTGAMESRTLNHDANYINYGRMAVPRTSNEYLAFKVVQPFPLQGSYLKIEASTVDANSIFRWTPQITPATILNHAPYLQNMFDSYSEFRIRSLRVHLQPLQKETVGMSEDTGNTQAMSQYAKLPVKSYIWYPRQHDGLNPVQEFDTYTEMLESGERFTKAGSNMDSSINMSWVPQVIEDQTQYGVFKQDVQMPWLQTTPNSANNVILYAPYLIWKRPLYIATGPIVEQPVAARYEVILHSVVEFRDLK